jgi:hypothetical protein
MASAAARTPFASPFQVEPYLQLGAGPSSPDRLALLWHAQHGIGDWAVEIKPQAGEGWARMAAPVSVLVEAPGAGAGPHRVWTASLAPLEPGLPFEYRVLQDETEVFRAEGKALKGPGQAQRVVVAGDLAEKDDLEAAAIVRQIHQQNPDLMVAAGDLVLPPDSLQQYRRTFFSLFNAGRTDPKAGAPFMRGTVLVRALSGRAPGLSTDRLAYGTYWDQPRDGPERWAGQLHGLSAAPAESRFPGAGNFFIQAGDVHGTVLDSRHWNDPGLKAWLDRELAGAQAARWRFVVFQRPDADPALRGQDDGAMKALWPQFLKYHVAIVFTGRQHLVVTGAADGGFRERTVGSSGPRPGHPAAAPGFSLLAISASRVVCKQIDSRGAALDSFILIR